MLLQKKLPLFFKPDYGLYSMAFIDIVYDHFLASDEHLFLEVLSELLILIFKNGHGGQWIIHIPGTVYQSFKTPVYAPGMPVV